MKTISSRIDDKYLEQLPEDVQEYIRQRQLNISYGKGDAWLSALEKKYSELDGLKIEQLVLSYWRIFIENLHRPGMAYSKFLAGLREGKIIGTRCSGCGRILIPPRSFCEMCFTHVSEEVEHTGEGIVSTYSVSYIGTDPSIRLQQPTIVAVIWFVDTIKHKPSSHTTTHAGGILHIIGETIPDKVRIGMHVVPVWRKPEQRVGSILDIAYFKPKVNAP
ncbi:MAG: Zn-ribbon domain-containing OB-fold protein [Candidatus Caldarchaeum sp.]